MNSEFIGFTMKCEIYFFSVCEKHFYQKYCSNQNMTKDHFCYIVHFETKLCIMVLFPSNFYNNWDIDKKPIGQI